VLLCWGGEEGSVHKQKRPMKERFESVGRLISQRPFRPVGGCVDLFACGYVKYVCMCVLWRTNDRKRCRHITCLPLHWELDLIGLLRLVLEKSV